MGVASADMASASSLLVLALALIGAGALMGFMSGLLGIGGGGIMVPVLYEVLSRLGIASDLALHVAIGTSLGVMIPTTLRSYRAHRKKGSGDSALLRSIAFWIILGVVAGSALAKFADDRALKWVWVIFGSVLAIKFAAAREDWKLANDLPGPPLINIYALAIGAVSTLMSIGGGAFFTSLMTLHGRPIVQAVATSSGVGPLIAVPGALGFIWAGWGVAGLPPMSLGYVNILGLLIIIPSSVLVAPLGVRAAHGIDKRSLSRIFAVFLVLITSRFLWSLLAEP